MVNGFLQVILKQRPGLNRFTNAMKSNALNGRDFRRFPATSVMLVFPIAKPMRSLFRVVPLF
jgi:hypothetical protein